MAKIKIKEENKGKFTAWAKSHGMSVQTAAATILRNREKYSPALIKRANFARNASKWEDGGEFALGGMFSMLEGFLTNIQQGQDQKRLMEEQQKSQSIGAADMGQSNILNNYTPVFKIGGQFRGKKFGGTPNATVGGGEIVITPDGIPTNMKGPSDMNGGQGMDVALPDSTIILSKKNSKDLLPLTNKINKSNEVLKGNASTMFAKNSAKRNLDKYMGTMMDAYSTQEMKKMSKGGKFDGGGDFRFYEKNLPYKSVMPGDPLAKYIWPNPNGSQAQPYPLGSANVSATPNMATDPIFGNFTNTNESPTNSPIGGNIPQAQTQNTGVGNIGGMNSHFTDLTKNFELAPSLKTGPASTLRGAPNVDTTGADTSDVLSGIGEMAPMLYNLGRGLFGKKDIVNDSRYANPYEGQVNSLMANRRYNIDAGLAGNEASYRTNAANMRNLGGSRGQVMSNLTGAQNAKQFADMALYGQKQNFDNQYKGEQANMMYGLGRDTVATRMNVDEGNRMTDAAKNNMVGAGMSGLQQYLLTRRQMKGQAGRDKLLINAIKAYSPYSAKWIPGLDALGR